MPRTRRVPAAREQEKKDAWDYNVNSQLKPKKPVYNK